MSLASLKASDYARAARYLISRHGAEAGERAAGRAAATQTRGAAAVHVIRASRPRESPTSSPT